MDVCLADDVNRTALCEAIEAYLADCRDAGGTVPIWRKPNFCRKLSIFLIHLSYDEKAKATNFMEYSPY